VTLTFDLKSDVRVTCDVGYRCANFSLPKPLCSRLRPDVRDRQTDVDVHHHLMPPQRGITYAESGDGLLVLVVLAVLVIV